MAILANYKHFSLTERVKIEHFLKLHYSFKKIANELNRHPSSVSNEIKGHSIVLRTGGHGKAFNNCALKDSCTKISLCSSPSCKFHFCKFCIKCSSICKEFSRINCHKLSAPPYVCNGCSERSGCTLEKHIYSPSDAQKEYSLNLTESRSGISTNESELARLDSIVSPLVLRGQSVHHIYANHADDLMCSEKTIYNYIDYSFLAAKNIDLPRKVKYKERKSNTQRFKIDKKCRIERTYEDFLKYLTDNPDTPVVEMDSVEGIKGGKVLLTIHFKQAEFMLAFLRDKNTSKSVIDVFDRLYYLFGFEGFDGLFPVILTDNGSEFSNPHAIEFDAQGNRRTRIFYCDPCASYQKGSCEVNHEMIRRILPKGTSFDGLTQEVINLMMNHINSYGRKKMNTRSPYQVFKSLYGELILHKLEAELISPDDITLLPTLLKK